MDRQNKPFVVIITGPTASGKTELSYNLAHHINGEIINADVGQFYTPLSVGTAKPDWRNNSIQSHLFDLLDEPEDLCVKDYYQHVVTAVSNITSRNRVPIIVGGSLFYIKSLLFPTKKIPTKRKKERVEEIIKSMPKTSLWNILNLIDSKRAQKIHKNDEYRIRRALEIWLTTDEKPSNFEPTFNPPFDFLFVVLLPEFNKLKNRIRLRTKLMINKDGWCHEAQKVNIKKWREFIIKKGLIGYQELFAWINDSPSMSLQQVIEKIEKETILYAKRQKTFINGLCNTLKLKYRESITTISDASPSNCEAIANFVLKQQQNILVGKK